MLGTSFGYLIYSHTCGPLGAHQEGTISANQNNRACFFDERIQPFDEMTLAFFLTFPFHNLTWAPIVVKGFWDKNKKEWSHTLHTRVLDLAEISHTNKA